MLTSVQLAAVLTTGVETVRVEFKERVEWRTSKRARLELIRDIVCLANRAGGEIIVGVKNHTGFEARGMGPGESLPDTTDVNVLIREHFRPTLTCELAPVEVEGKTFGVISVPEFGSYPHACYRAANDESNASVLRIGDIPYRTDAANCERLGPDDLALLIDKSVERRGSALRRMFTEPLGDASSPRSAFDREAFARYPTLRAADFKPSRAIDPVRLRDLERYITAHHVRQRGGTYFPRYIDTPRDERMTVLRLEHELIVEVEAATFASDERVLSAIRLSRTVEGSVRESLWEDRHGSWHDKKVVGVLSMVGFTAAALLFASRIYTDLSVDQIDCAIGLSGPLGRELVVDSERRSPFFSPYRSTSAADLWVRRQVPMSVATETASRANVTFGICEELFDYFGYEMPRNIFDEILGELRGHGGAPDL